MNAPTPCRLPRLALQGSWSILRPVMPLLSDRAGRVLAVLMLFTAWDAGAFANLPVTITVDAAQPQGPLKPIYRFFGADEPNYSYMKDGRRLLRDIGRLGEAPAYFRTHSLLVTGDGTPALKWGSTNVYTEDAAGQIGRAHV